MEFGNNPNDTQIPMIGADEVSDVDLNSDDDILIGNFQTTQLTKYQQRCSLLVRNWRLIAGLLSIVLIVIGGYTIFSSYGAPTKPVNTQVNRVPTKPINEQDIYTVVFTVKTIDVVDTIPSNFTMTVYPKWAPKGAERFFDLTMAKYWDECRFFRVVKDFVVQWGISGTPSITKKWDITIDDDPAYPGVSNKEAYVSFATAGANTRTTQLFINTKDNIRLDGMGFTPFAKITSGMDVVKSLYDKYNSKEISQSKLTEEGNKYLKENYPLLGFIVATEIIQNPSSL